MSELFTNEISTLPPVERAKLVLVSTKTEADLLAMVKESSDITEVKDIAGRTYAHQVGMMLKKARTTIQKTGKTAREDATAFCTAVINEEKRLISITEGEEKRVIGLRDAFDAKVEAERKAAEAKREEAKAKIEQIRSLPASVAGCTAVEIEVEKQALQDFTPTEDEFGDLTSECAQVVHLVSGVLSEMHARVAAQEFAAAALAAERKRMEEELAAQRAQMEAERAKMEEIKAAQRAQMEAMRAEIEAERAKMQAIQAEIEAERIKAEQAALPPEPEPAIEDDHPDVADPYWHDYDDTAEVLDILAEEPAPEPDAPVIVTPEWDVAAYLRATAEQFLCLSEKAERMKLLRLAMELEKAGGELVEIWMDGDAPTYDENVLMKIEEAIVTATHNTIDTFSS